MRMNALAFKAEASMEEGTPPLKDCMANLTLSAIKPTL